MKAPDRWLNGDTDGIESLNQGTTTRARAGYSICTNSLISLVEFFT